MQAYGLARIGRDAEVRTTGQNESVCNLSLAFSYGRKGEDNRKPTQWVEGTLWGKRAEALEQYLVKGQLVMVTIDDVHIETFTTREGVEQPKLVGKVSTIDFAGPPPGGDSKPAPAPRAASRAPAPAPRQASRAAAPSAGFEDMDDDIPFISCDMSFDMLSKLDRRMLRRSC